MPSKRLVVCTPAETPAPSRLPKGEFVERPWISGGERLLHHLAFAAAATGQEVELRGWLDRPLVDELAAAAGVAVTVPGEDRVPTSEDVVVTPEGHDDPMHYLRAWLSEAQLVLMVMAPIGLFGWPFLSEWQRRSPLEVTVEEVNRPESYRAIAAMGIPIWADSAVITELARSEGARASTVGSGQPMPFPEPPGEKAVDVAWLENNRWAPRARELMSELDCTVDAIGVVDHDEMLAQLGAARVLVYPGGLEGEPTITREARALGVVPVVLKGNPLCQHLSEEDGVLAVERLEEIPSAIEAVLADGARLATLAACGVESARAEVAWDPFVARVAEALDELPDHDPATGARAAMGARLVEFGAEAQEHIAELDAEILRAHALGARELAIAQARYDELTA
ncbi:MAG TPA: hypothetical protein VIJ20_03830, partial [Solirubrobacteraceae bacterium]